MWSQKSERRKAEAARIGGEAYRSEGFPGGSAVKNPPASEGDRRWRLEFNPWVGKISWIKKWQPMLVLLPGKPHRQRSPLGTRVCGLTHSWTRLRGGTHTPTQERVMERKKLQKSAEEFTVPLTTEVLVDMIQLYKNKQRTTCNIKQIILRPHTRLGNGQPLTSLVYRSLNI